MLTAVCSRCAQYQILRQKGTEGAGTGQYNKHKEDGVYNCAGCGTPLYTSETKFDSGCGWCVPRRVSWPRDHYRPTIDTCRSSMFEYGRENLISCTSSQRSVACHIASSAVIQYPPPSMLLHLDYIMLVGTVGDDSGVTLRALCHAAHCLRLCLYCVDVALMPHPTLRCAQAGVLRRDPGGSGPARRQRLRHEAHRDHLRQVRRPPGPRFRGRGAFNQP